WRTGIEDLIWDLTGGTSVPAADVREKLSQVAKVDLQPSSSDRPIVCIDQDYRPLPEACSAEAVIRIQPDDWPAYASQAWTTVELARQHPRLRALVVDEDLDKISPQDDAVSRSRCGSE